MFASIFDPDNGFWRLIAKFTDVLALSVLWLLCSVPLVTLGAMYVGMKLGGFGGLILAPMAVTLLLFLAIRIGGLM